MEQLLNAAVLSSFGLSAEDFKISRFGSGLINRTYLLQSLRDGNNLVLQQINSQVFADPWAVANNHRLAADYLQQQHPEYFFLRPFRTVAGDELAVVAQSYWRLIPFVDNAIAIDQAVHPKQAFEAAKQFGRLVRYLSGVEVSAFKPTIPHFHDLTLRYNAFQQALHTAAAERLQFAETLVESFLKHSAIATLFAQLKADKDFRDRVMHHDTKINNVLLDKTSFEGVCVIDLDTLMPGKLISDLGDMVRTYVSPVSEEEQDFSKIMIREDYYEALMRGYLSEVKDDLTKTERELLYYAGQCIVYMQGLRFLTDYLNGDVYYPVKYPTHNYQRAKNQFTLLERLLEKEKPLRQLIANCLRNG